MAEFAFYCNSFATASGDHEKDMIRRAGEADTNAATGAAGAKALGWAESASPIPARPPAVNEKLALTDP